MKTKELKLFAIQFAQENPNLKYEIFDLVDLAISEIEEGGSETIECERAKRDILELLNEEE